MPMCMAVQMPKALCLLRKGLRRLCHLWLTLRLCTSRKCRQDIVATWLAKSRRHAQTHTHTAFWQKPGAILLPGI